MLCKDCKNKKTCFIRNDLFSGEIIRGCPDGKATDRIEAINTINKQESNAHKNAKSYDTVNNPKHYTSGNIECIDAMISAFGASAVKHFCKLNAFKYLWREDKKNGVEDLEKAKWYLNKYIELSKE